MLSRPVRSASDIARAIDHSVLGAGVGMEVLDRACDDCGRLGLAALCIYPWWVERAVARIDPRCAVSAVIAFPSGLETTRTKVESIREAVAAGARELDAVCAWTAIRSGDLDVALRDAEAMVTAALAENPRVIVKLIPEIGELTRSQQLDAAWVVAASGAHFLKAQHRPGRSLRNRR